MNNWNRYTIMHGNRKVACVHQDGSCVIYSRKFMPYNLYLEPAEASNVKTIGLNQKFEVKKQWFCDENQWQMFNARLEYLKSKQG